MAMAVFEDDGFADLDRDLALLGLVEESGILAPDKAYADVHDNVFVENGGLICDPTRYPTVSTLGFLAGSAETVYLDINRLQ